MPKVVFVPDTPKELVTPVFERLEQEGFDVGLIQHPRFNEHWHEHDVVVKELKGAAAVIAGGETYNGAVLDELPDLRVIARHGVGFDRVDVKAARARNIVVTVTPNANHEAVAEQAIAQILAVARGTIPMDRRVRAGAWRQAILRPVRQTTLGIVGLGRIGRSTAVKAEGLGMKIIAFESMPHMEFVRQHNIELVDFDALLARSDYITIHCPLSDETRGMFNRQTLAKMKPGSVLVNTARGGMIVEADLIEALKNGPLRAAALDVFEQEPPPADNPLFGLDNVVLSPHIAGIDTMSVHDMAMEAADCIIRLKRGEWPEDAALNNELKADWKW